MKENEVMIYAVKSDDKFKYIGKTNKRLNTKDKKIRVQAQYKNKPLRDLFLNYENVSVEQIILVPESKWYPEKLREIKEHNNHPLLNAEWMIECKRGYWDGKKRDANTLQMLSESKYKKFVEYDKDGKIKKIWNSGKEAAIKIFKDYHVINGGGISKLYRITENQSIKSRFAHNSYWFKVEELIHHFNGVPNKLHIQNIIKKHEENKRYKRKLSCSERTKTSRYTINCYNRKSGELTVYQNAQEATFKLKTYPQLINRLCTGKARPARDFIFKYGEKKLQDININYPNYTIIDLPRVLIDTESERGIRSQMLKQQKEIIKQEKLKQLILEKEKAKQDDIDKHKKLVNEYKNQIGDITQIRIDDLIGLSVRTRNSLRYVNIETIGDLIEYDVKHLLYVKNFGVKCLGEIEKILKEFNLELS